jgi:predicted neutral ceramidase superfamily lipid hydrolase
MLDNIIYIIIVFVLVLRFFYPIQVLTNSFVLVISNLLSILIIQDVAISEAVVTVILLNAVGLYRMKFFWEVENESEGKIWNYPGLILLTSISLGIIFILINDNLDLVNKVLPGSFEGLSLFSVLIITCIYLKTKER